jgi:hypothetical protein
MDGRIKGSVITMNHYRQIWQSVATIIDAHGSLPESAYWRYYLNIYTETQAMAVRRQADLRRGVASLAKLLSQITEDAKRLTPEWWAGLWNIDEEDDYERTYARGQWDAEYGGKVGVHLDPAIPAKDLDRLIAGSKKVKKYVDKHVAHSEDPGPAPKDPGPTPVEATLYVSDVHDAIDLINEVFKRYYRLFEAASITLEPVIQHDWQAIFREPWIPPGKS